MPTTRPEKGFSRTRSANRRCSMNSTPFSRAENSSGRARATPLLTAPGATERLALFICTGANALVRSGSATPASSAVIVPALDVGLVTQHEEAARPPRAREAAAAVGAADAREPHVVVDEKLPRAGQFSAHARESSRFVVAVRALGLAVDDRPVGEVGEQEIDAVVELFRRLGGVGGDEPLLVALALHVADLHGVAPRRGTRRPRCAASGRRRRSSGRPPARVAPRSRARMAAVRPAHPPPATITSTS